MPCHTLFNFQMLKFKNLNSYLLILSLKLVTGIINVFVQITLVWFILVVNFDKIHNFWYAFKLCYFDFKVLF